MNALTALKKINDRYNRVSVLALREELARMGCTVRAEQDRAIDKARRANLIYLEGAEHRTSEEESKAGIWDRGTLLLFASIRNS